MFFVWSSKKRATHLMICSLTSVWGPICCSLVLWVWFVPNIVVVVWWSTSTTWRWDRVGGASQNLGGIKVTVINDESIGLFDWLRLFGIKHHSNKDIPSFILHVVQIHRICIFSCFVCTFEQKSVHLFLSGCFSKSSGHADDQQNKNHEFSEF